MRLTMLLMAFSLLGGCSTIERPDIEFMIVNAPLKQRCGYNFKDGYDEDGHVIPGAPKICRPNESLEDLNKIAVVDSKTGPEDALAGLKSYMKLLREEYENLKARCQAAMQAQTQ